MIYYLMLFVAAIGIAGNFAVTKVYQKNMGNAMRESVIFNMIVGLFSTVFFWIAGGFKVDFTPYSVVMAFLMSLFVGVYTVIGFKLMSMGSMTVYTIFVMLGGAVVPYVYGVIFLEESINAVKIIALLMIVVAVVLNGSGEKKRQTDGNLYSALCCGVYVERCNKCCIKNASDRKGICHCICR